MTRQEAARVLRVILGLLAIAKLAMPDTYYMSDTRVKRAQELAAKMRELL